MIRIVVPGAPIGKGRPRFFIRRNAAATGGKMLGASVDRKTANYEAVLAAAAMETVLGPGWWKPLEGPLRIGLTAFMPIPSSWSRKKRQDAFDGTIRPGKPDLDNILKIMDALNNIVWRDDAQIAEAWLSKFYGLQPRLEIEVEQLGIETVTGDGN